jgi:tetratricopeptide (TPR) repeat protein
LTALPLLAAALCPAAANADVDTPALNAYARARLADGEGALNLAVSSYRQALAIDPSSKVVALRSYRQAIESGDRKLALSSAYILDRANALPKDGALLLTVDALDRKDWATARLLSRRMVSEANFGFLAPILDSWISTASGPYAPPVAGEEGRFGALTQRYIDEHRALQLLSQGQGDAAMPAIGQAIAMASGGGMGMRLEFAMRLAALGKKDEALVLLPEQAPVLASARAEIARGKRPSVQPITPAEGFARLLGRLGDDLSTTDSRSISLVLLRIASFADPGNAEYRTGVARQLSVQRHPESALAEAEKVPAKSPFYLAAQDVRVEALAASGREDEAVALARQVATRPDAGAGEQTRLANILVDGKQYDAAVDAYRAAKARYPANSVPWTLYLLEGSALERGGRWDEGKVALEKAAALAPEEPAVLNYLGYAQVERGQNVEAALALLEKASRLKPDDPSITDSLGWGRYKAGDPKGAVIVLEKAAEAAPDDVTINEHLGDALWTVGRRFEARYAWAAASTFADAADADRIGRKMREGLNARDAAH